MFTNTRAIAVASFLLLSMLSGLAAAADRPPLIDKSACDAPAYPLAWQNEDKQGAVVLDVLVSADGNVADAKVVESSGYAKLDKASLQAGAKCKFKPATRNGQSAQSWVKVRYLWEIN
jgi:protein TonB